MTLQERRKAKHISQERLSEILSVNRSTVSKWESGRAYPRTRLLPVLAKLFDCTIDDLLTDQKEVS